jgi:Tfp pilus assembly protein PilF
VVAQAVRPPGDTLKLDKGAAQELAAGVSALNAGDLEAAQQRLEMALGFDPAAHQIHFQLGVVHGKRGRVFEAIASFERALSLAPRLFAAVRSLAMLYQKAGFANKAKEMWERSLILAPDEPTRESIREHLRRLG